MAINGSAEDRMFLFVRRDNSRRYKTCIVRRGSNEFAMRISVTIYESFPDPPACDCRDARARAGATLGEFIEHLFSDENSRLLVSSAARYKSRLYS